MLKLHPDKHSGSSPSEKAEMASKATDVTRAYDVLSNPLERAEHLLELRGMGIEEGDSVSFLHCVLILCHLESTDNVSILQVDNRPIPPSTNNGTTRRCRQCLHGQRAETTPCNMSK